MQKVCFSDREKSSELLYLNCDPWEAIHLSYPSKTWGRKFHGKIVVIPKDLY
ncbi:hypothetical protein LEP1GSC041_1076 [Leptospira noguchii str. 2006001870]|nr:hypothetical protein LEP1GSC041_1076 [Leptospira noguchii str. 2006001870]